MGGLILLGGEISPVVVYDRTSAHDYRAVKLSKIAMSVFLRTRCLLNFNQHLTRQITRMSSTKPATPTIPQLSAR